MGYNLSPQFSQLLVSRYSQKGCTPGIQLDRFIHICTLLQTMTEAFREKDTGMTGTARISYEDFLMMSATRMLWNLSFWETEDGPNTEDPASDCWLSSKTEKERHEVFGTKETETAIIYFYEADASVLQLDSFDIVQQIGLIVVDCCCFM